MCLIPKCHRHDNLQPDGVTQQTSCAAPGIADRRQVTALLFDKPRISALPLVGHRPARFGNIASIGFSTFTKSSTGAPQHPTHREHVLRKRCTVYNTQSPVKA